MSPNEWHVSPLIIDIMLWYYTRPGDYRDGELDAPAVRSAVDGLLSCPGGPLLRSLPEPREARYEITDRGTAWVAALCSTPFPVQKWVMP